MNAAPVKILDWGRIYHESLTTEILRSEQRRVTILAGLDAAQFSGHERCA